MGHYSSFILRFWVEPPDGPRWGVIQHVASREKFKFQLTADGSVEDLIEFIRAHSADNEITLPFTLSMGEAPDIGPASTPPVASVPGNSERKRSGETNE